MKHWLSISFLLIIVIIAVPISAIEVDPQIENKAVEIGGGFGWGAPYGFGIEGSFYIIPHANITGGIGISMSGVKIGVGTKYFFKPFERLSPFIGANLSYSGGMSNLNVSINQDTAVYGIDPANFVSLRTGFRYDTGSIYIYGNLGYGIPISGGKSHYQSGSTLESISDLAEIIEPGGLEISISIGIRLSR